MSAITVATKLGPYMVETLHTTPSGKLAIHEQVTSVFQTTITDGEHLTLTHIPTGRAVCDTWHGPDTMPRFQALADDLDGLDWDFTDHEQIPSATLKKVTVRLAEFMVAEGE